MSTPCQLPQLPLVAATIPIRKCPSQPACIPCKFRQEAITTIATLAALESKKVTRHSTHMGSLNTLWCKCINTASNCLNCDMQVPLT